jgi:hypothetical protein
MGRGGNGAGWAALLAGVASIATMPVAIYVTRFVGSYELLDAAYAIPVGALLGVTALALTRRAQRRGVLRLSHSGSGLVTSARVLGTLGLCVAGTAVISLAVYGILEYWGSRD